MTADSRLLSVLAKSLLAPLTVLTIVSTSDTESFRHPAYVETPTFKCLHLEVAPRPLTCFVVRHNATCLHKEKCCIVNADRFTFILCIVFCAEFSS